MIEESNHNKTILIIIGALLLAFLAAGAYFLFFPHNGTSPIPGSGGTPPVGGGGVTPPGGGSGTSTPFATTTSPFVRPDPNAPTIEIPTTSGTAIHVKNFFHDPKKMFSDYVDITETSYYTLLFINYDQSFLISITNPDIHRARAVAESDIPIILGIPAKDVCSLKFSLTVPGDVNLQASGRDYGLSFCPNGIPF